MQMLVAYMRDRLLLILPILFYCNLLPGQNIAINKKITILPTPNYTSTVEKLLPSALTNGVYSIRSPMWLDTATLGWMKSKLITILIDLEKVKDIGEIVISTAYSGNGDVNIPSNIFVFSSSDSIKFSLVGEIVDDVPHNNVYSTIKLKLKFTDIRGRYILLKIIPNGNYFFADEIEVLRSLQQQKPKNITNKRPKLPSFETADADQFVKQSLKSSNSKKILRKHIKELTKIKGNQANERLLKALEFEISQTEELNDASTQSYKNTLVSLLSNSSYKKLVVNAINPFTDKINFIHAPALQINKIDTLLNICDGGVEYAGFYIYNGARKKEKVRLLFNNINRITTTSLYYQKFVDTKDFKTVPDALIPIKNGSEIVLSPGETKYFMIKFTGKKPGIETSTVTLRTTTYKIITNYKLKVNAVIIDSSKLKLNANVWAYFNNSFLKGKEKSAWLDLLSHHINTLVIPPSALSFYDQSHLEKNLTEYLKFGKGFNKIFVFLELANEIKGSSFFSKAWKESFLTWYDATHNILEAYGFKSQYLYLFDEISIKNIPVFIKITQWLKEVRPSVKFFGTVNNAEAVSKLSSVLNVIQIHLNTENLNSDWFNESPNKSNKWIYDTKSPLKSLSPYIYFRLMGWEAYSKGADGIGFWNYADMGSTPKELSAWDDFDGANADYSVVYNSGDEIISSRRWEAFKLGMEDHEILWLYEKKFGKKAALEFCKQVLAKPADEQLADEIKTEMIKLLQ